MKKLTTDTLVIGAGPAGLAAAMELLKAEKDFILVERDARVGGLSKTFTFSEDGLLFRTDNGPHRFFSKNPYLYEFIENLIKEKWISVKRQTRQYIDGKFFDYPINAFQALRNIGFFKAVRMVVDYAIARVHYGLLRKEVTNFEDYVVSRFGRSLGEFNMINYTEKIWGIPAREIHTDWAAQRIKGLSLTAIFKDILRKTFRLSFGSKPKTLIDTFYYPQFGTGLIYETIAEKLIAGGRQILLQSEPISIAHENGRVKEAIIKTPEGEIAVSFNNLIETVPLPKFIHLLSPRLPEVLFDAAAKMKYRSQVYVFVTLDRESVTADQWIYFPKKDIPFGRVSEMRNFSSDMSPKGKTSLFIEFFCFEGDEVWNMDDDRIGKLAITSLVDQGFIAASEVRRSYVIRQKDVYPIYDLQYKEYLNEVKKHLDLISNLFYIGRPGRFRYNNQDHSLEMGILAAKSVIEGKRYDIEKVGDEQEYFESGKLKTTS